MCEDVHIQVLVKEPVPVESKTVGSVSGGYAPPAGHAQDYEEER